MLRCRPGLMTGRPRLGARRVGGRYSIGGGGGGGEGGEGSLGAGSSSGESSDGGGSVGESSGGGGGGGGVGSADDICIGDRSVINRLRPIRLPERNCGTTSELEETGIVTVTSTTAVDSAIGSGLMVSTASRTPIKSR